MSYENPYDTLIQGQCYQLMYRNPDERPKFIGLSIFHNDDMNVYDVLRFGEGFIVVNLRPDGYVDILGPRGVGQIMTSFHQSIVFKLINK